MPKPLFMVFSWFTKENWLNNRWCHMWIRIFETHTSLSIINQSSIIFCSLDNLIYYKSYLRIYRKLVSLIRLSQAGFAVFLLRIFVWMHVYSYVPIYQSVIVIVAQRYYEQFLDNRRKTHVSECSFDFFFFFFFLKLFGVLKNLLYYKNSIAKFSIENIC